MTKQELDRRLLENGYKPEVIYAFEDPGWRAVSVIKKEKNGYSIYSHDRGLYYYETNVKTLEEAYDYIWKGMRMFIKQ